jgi:hypothetical protein
MDKDSDLGHVLGIRPNPHFWNASIEPIYMLSNW